MTDPNAYNFENYGQEQTDFLGTTEGDTQFISQNISPMDPSAYFQGDNNVLQESAGIGNVKGNADFLNQETTTTFNADSLDSNAIFGQTLQNETQIPENYGEQTTTTTNVIEGNNYFDTNQIQDANTFMTEGNIDTNAFFTNEQTNQQKTTTTTTTNEYFGQTQDMQPAFGETQILQGTEANNFFEANPNDFGQIQTQQGQDIYAAYQATKTDDLNSFGYGTAETQQVISPQPQTEIANPPPEPYFPPTDNQIVQTQTTTTTTKTVTQPNFGMQFTNQNVGSLDYEAYPATNAPTKNKPPQPQFDVAQFQQTLDATPLTTSTTFIQNQDFSPQAQQPITIQQAVPTPAPKVIATPQPIVQATYTPPPQKVTVPAPRPIAKAPTQVRYVKRTVPRTVPRPVQTIVTPPPVTVAPQPQIVQQTYQVQTANQPQIIQQNYQTQPGQLAGYQYINKLIDEDFRRGRPIYNEPGVAATKLKAPQNNQLNTYKVGNIVGLNNNKIGLSRLGHSNSYSNLGINTPTLKNPNIITPNVNIPNINTPNINIPNINTPNINLPSINTPNLNTNLGNVISDNTRGINTNLGNAINNNINNLNTNIGNNVNNAINNVNSELDKIGKASSYNVGANSITPLLNNVGLNINNGVTTDNKLPQLKDFI